MTIAIITRLEMRSSITDVSGVFVVLIARIIIFITIVGGCCCYCGDVGTTSITLFTACCSSRGDLGEAGGGELIALDGNPVEDSWVCGFGQIVVHPARDEVDKFCRVCKVNAVVWATHRCGGCEDIGVVVVVLVVVSTTRPRGQQQLLKKTSTTICLGAMVINMAQYCMEK